jgi:hypothetical protein
LLSGIAVRQGFNAVIKPMPIVSTLIGGAAAFSTFAACALLNQQYRKYPKECAAGKFAYEKLIEHEKNSTAIGKMSDHLYKHEYGKKSLPSFISGYPTEFERAAIGIKAFQEKGM